MIAQQMEEFQRRGVDSLVLHPRIGLPNYQGWGSEELGKMLRFALDEAQRRGMSVMLYDEGMCPSGSAAGQVVQGRPDLLPRALRQVAAHEPLREGDEVLQADAEGHRVVVGLARSHLRGLHFAHHGKEEVQPLAADLLNPEAVNRFIQFSHEWLAGVAGPHLGTTAWAIFTDEPTPLSRCEDPDALAFWDSLFDEMDRPADLFDLWRQPEARAAHRYATANRLCRVFYEPVAAWCTEHGVSLAGHPAGPCDTAAMAAMHVPGQDMVWRNVLPGEPSGLRGTESTQAKAAASVAFLHGKVRNLNEFGGAYGDELTFEQFRALADWCLVRGTDLLVPHAFYYSVTGPRREDRPPDVGPHSPWWAEFGSLSAYLERMCKLNATMQPACDVLVLGEDGALPDQAAAELMQRQVDFHYVTGNDLAAVAKPWFEGLLIRHHEFRAVVIDGVEPAQARGILSRIEPSRLVRFTGDGDRLVRDLEAVGVRRVWALPRPPSLRTRFLQDENFDALILFNEGKEPIEFELPEWSMATVVDPWTLRVDLSRPHRLSGFGVRVLFRPKIHRPA